MTVREIVNECAGREVGEDEAEYVLWDLTGFPCFFRVPQDGATSEEVLRRQLREAFGRPALLGSGVLPPRKETT